MRPFPFKVWFWYTFRKHWDGECLVLTPYSHVLGTQQTSFPDAWTCILVLKVLPAATPAHWYWLPRWGLWAPCSMAHLFIVLGPAIAVDGQQRNLSQSLQKKKEKKEEFQRQLVPLSCDFSFTSLLCRWQSSNVLMFVSFFPFIICILIFFFLPFPPLMLLRR